MAFQPLSDEERAHPLTIVNGPSWNKITRSLAERNDDGSRCIVRFKVRVTKPVREPGSSYVHPFPPEVDVCMVGYVQAVERLDNNHCHLEGLFQEAPNYEIQKDRPLQTARIDNFDTAGLDRMTKNATRAGTWYWLPDLTED